jgi:hypothetical protein
MLVGVLRQDRHIRNDSRMISGRWWSVKNHQSLPSGAMSYANWLFGICWGDKVCRRRFPNHPPPLERAAQQRPQPLSSSLIVQLTDLTILLSMNFFMDDKLFECSPSNADIAGGGGNRNIEMVCAVATAFPAAFHHHPPLPLHTLTIKHAFQSAHRVDLSETLISGLVL